jgi:hypothetical protein
MSDYKNAPNGVNYPHGKIPTRNQRNEIGIYQWFTLNKGGVGKSRFTDVLPRATDANGHINPEQLALHGYEQYETENPVQAPKGNIKSVIATFPAAEEAVTPAPSAVHQTQPELAPANPAATQADVQHRPTNEEMNTIRKLRDLTTEAGKSYMMPKQVKTAKDKLSAYLQKNPRPDDASPELAKAYDEAEAKLKQAK